LIFLEATRLQRIASRQVAVAWQSTMQHFSLQAEDAPFIIGVEAFQSHSLIMIYFA